MSARRPARQTGTARALRSRIATLILGAVVAPLSSSAAVAAATLPDGFQETVVFSGLDEPTAVRFAPDGRVFVAEKGGLVKVFNGLNDTTPDVLIDLSVQVHDYWDRGLLGLAVDPDFPQQPYVYVAYTYNFDPADPDAGMPRWPDSCPDPPGGTTDGCVVNGRVSRIEVGPGNTAVGGEQVLIENRWCSQYPSHTVGDLVFDHHRLLYVSGGDGASFSAVDYGQGGGSAGSPVPPNPCDDPPWGRGTALAPPSAEGGALRPQDLRTAGDPVSYDGAVLRIDPDTGLPPVDNPLVGGDPDDDAIIAYGLRNPFRMAFRPGAHDLWIGDVGWSTWEEIDRIADVGDAIVENFGWPCYEGKSRQAGYDSEDLTICEALYADTVDPATNPIFAYDHADHVDPDPQPFRCTQTGSSSISGMAFYTGGVYPSRYDNALFWADYSRRCLFVLYADASGKPDPASADAFGDNVSDPVSLEVGPDGLLYYTDLTGGRIVRIDYTSTNQPPVAVAVATPSDGPVPLLVQFDGSGSTDPDPGTTLTYAWDLDGDGLYDDSDLVAPQWTYTAQEEVVVGLQVTDDEGAVGTDQIVVTAGNTAPVATITAPDPALLWRVGDQIAFSGGAVDPEDGPLPASALHWDVLLHHCPGGPGDCHVHPLVEFDGVASGTVTAPDHEWYAYLEFVLTATDQGFPGGEGGVLEGEDRVSVDPRSVALTFDTAPTGLDLVVGPTRQATPFDRTVIVKSSNSVSAPSPQNFQGGSYLWESWSDGGGRSHTIVGPDTAAAYVATFVYDGIATDWWDRDWRSRTRMTIDNAARSSDLIDFPVLVVLDASRVDYSRIRADGGDLRFVDADAVTVLPYEIETFDPGGVSRIWVRVPRIDGNSSQDFFWMYYENPSASAPGNGSDVWSNGYAGVWHLNADLQDSGPFGNGGTDHGTTTTVGVVGEARSFDGTAWIDVGADPSLGLDTDATLSAWVRIADPEMPSSMRILSKKDQWFSAAGYNLEYLPSGNSLTMLSSGTDWGRADGVDLDTGWHLVTGVIQGTSARLFVDGAEKTTDATCSALAADTQSLDFGRRSGDGEYFVGDIDEVRLASVARSADWISAAYASARDSLLLYEPAESNCGPTDDTCNGWDEDCDGLVDDDVVTPPPAASVTVDRTALSWNAERTATAYDVVRGSLTVLRATTGDFAQAADACLADDEPGTTLAYDLDPPAGEGHWFVVRAVNCAGVGSYDSGAPSQASGRDAGIGASPEACP